MYNDTDNEEYKIDKSEYEKSLLIDHAKNIHEEKILKMIEKGTLPEFYGTNSTPKNTNYFYTFMALVCAFPFACFYSPYFLGVGLIIGISSDNILNNKIPLI